MQTIIPMVRENESPRIVGVEWLQFYYDRGGENFNCINVLFLEEDMLVFMHLR